MPVFVWSPLQTRFYSSLYVVNDFCTRVFLKHIFIMVMGGNKQMGPGIGKLLQLPMITEETKSVDVR